MKLAQAFIRLPLQFDVERLVAEIHALPPSAWASHPNRFDGNTAVRLITVDGRENEGFVGSMAPTPHLQQSPYLRQVLASFATVWSRSRLMRLAPGAVVPEHSDVNYHWFNRVRVHIPVLTQPGVRFWCGEEVVHMAAGEAWVFDNWQQHRVENATDRERIHLVADTTGSAAFWNIVAAGMRGEPARRVPYEPGRQPNLMLESHNQFRVMHPAEVDVLLGDLAADLVAKPPATPASAAQFSSLMTGFRADWRQLWLLHGDSEGGMPQFRNLLKSTIDRVRQVGSGLRTRSNDLPASVVFEARLEVAVASGDRRSA